MAEAALPPGLWERIRIMIRDEVGKLLRSGFLRSASIGEGGLTVREGFIRVQNDDGTVTTLYIGGIFPAMPDGTSQRGMILRREDGSLAMALYDPDPGDGFKQFLALYDRGGKQTVVDDTESGQGLARPYIGGGFSRARFTDWTSTISTSFETLFTARVYKQHPRLEVSARASMDTSGSTGEMRVLVDGAQLGTTTSEAFALSTRYFGPAPIAGDHMGSVLVEIQGRVASGAGALRVEPRYWVGRQS